MPSISPNAFDFAIIATYFIATIFVGWIFRVKAKSPSEFFHARRSLPTWVTAIAFVAANCGALEIVGIVSATAKYGTQTLHFYLIGAVPAMLFLALFMMPIYMGSRALTVPEFLKLRYDESTRALNIGCSVLMMVLVSGISLYALAQVLRTFLGWTFTETTISAAVIVFIYVSVGGLTATIYNEVIQFVLILLGLAPLAVYILRDFQDLHGLAAKLDPAMIHTWVGLPISSPQAARVDVLGTAMGLGFVLGFGYWCTDFLLVQRALAARTTAGVISTPLIAALVKLAFPVVVVIPGLAAAILFVHQPGFRFDQSLPSLMLRYYGHGLLGFGITAILASLMSGLAGNINAITTIWTHDVYRASIAPAESDRHYVIIGRLSTFVAILLSVATAYFALSFSNIMDYLQLLFSLFNAPLFATFLLGMFTTWVTPKAGFWGLLIGTLTSIAHNLAYRMHSIRYGSDMGANFYGAIFAFTVCFVLTIAISTVTPAKPLESLANLTFWTSSAREHRLPLGALALALVAALLFAVLSVWLR